jgi:hypothetical protein
VQRRKAPFVARVRLPIGSRDFLHFLTCTTRAGHMAVAVQELVTWRLWYNHFAWTRNAFSLVLIIDVAAGV